MNISKYLKLLLFALPLVLTSCGDDDSEGGSGSKDINRNANTTEKGLEASRLEMPKLKKGNNYIFLVRSTGDIGVNYCIEWDCVNHAQRWTCWEWNSSNSAKNWSRTEWSKGATFNGYGGHGDPFQPDPDLPAEYRTELTDYSGSGYNRGHMCASEDRICSKEVNGQTFYLSNMHPQIGAHNSGIWSSLEAKARTWRDNTIRSAGTMYICKGGTIDDVTIDGKKVSGIAEYVKGKVPVPKYFFMAILRKSATGLYSGVAIWTEHRSYSASEYSDASRFMISINELEARTGFDFFCNLPDNIEESVEGTFTPSEWK